MTVSKNTRVSFRNRIASPTVETLENRQLFTAALYNLFGGNLNLVNTSTGVEAPVSLGNLNSIFVSGDITLGTTAVSNGLLYFLEASGSISSFDPTSGSVAAVANVGDLGKTFFNATDAGFAPGPNGLFYTAAFDGDHSLVQLDPASGSHTAVAILPGEVTGGISTDGANGLYVTCEIAFIGELVHVDLSNFGMTVIGPTNIGSTNVMTIQQLALGSDGELYGVDNHSNLMAIDPGTGATTATPSAGNANFIATAPASDLLKVTPSPLSPSFSSTAIPASTIVGQKFKGVTKVTVSNSSSNPLKGTVALFASINGTVDSTTPQISASKKITVKGNKSTTIPLNPAFSGLSAGNYKIVAQVTDSTGLSSISSKKPGFNIVAATVNLVATLTSTSKSIALGKPLSLTLSLTNNGNTKSAGPALVTLYLSTDGAAQTTSVATVRTATTVKGLAGKSKLKLKIKVPKTLDVTAGSIFYPLIVFTQGTATVTTAAPTALSVS